jgi:hypothetical protein
VNGICLFFFQYLVSGGFAKHLVETVFTKCGVETWNHPDGAKFRASLAFALVPA